MTDTSTETIERFNVTDNRHGLGFSDGLEFDPEGDYISYRNYQAIAAERDALQTKLGEEIAFFGDAVLIAHLSGASESKDAYVAGAAKQAAVRIAELEKALSTSPKVKLLVWEKSETGNGWDGDYHTVPTGYTIRGQGNEDYRLSFTGGFSVGNSPDAMKLAANVIHEIRILSALETA